MAVVPCSETRVLAGASRAAPRIYVYPLHSNYTYCRSDWSWTNYGSEQAIPEANDPLQCHVAADSVIAANMMYVAYQHAATHLAQTGFWCGTNCAPLSSQQHDSNDKSAWLQAVANSSYVTQDPNAADLFLVPLVAYCLDGTDRITFTDRGAHRQPFHQLVWKVRFPDMIPVSCVCCAQSAQVAESMMQQMAELQHCCQCTSQGSNAQHSCLSA